VLTTTAVVSCWQHSTNFLVGSTPLTFKGGLEWSRVYRQSSPTKYYEIRAKQDGNNGGRVVDESPVCLLRSGCFSAQSNVGDALI